MSHKLLYTKILSAALNYRVGSKFQLAKGDILRQLKSNDSRVYQKRELSKMLLQHRESWHIPETTIASEFIWFLSDKLGLKELDLKSSDEYQSIRRYAWGAVTPYQVALSIKKGAYLSHATAAFLHDFNTDSPTTLYINSEQSPKPSPKGQMTQKGIDRAFATPQRRSQNVFTWNKHRIVLLNGKHTNRLGVSPIPSKTRLEVNSTDPERTLIDIAVRPDYSGGPRQVLSTYTSARNTISVEKLYDTLLKMEHRYPYHQTIGFLLTRAGFPAEQTRRFMDHGLSFDFYLCHSIEQKKHDKEWRIWYPADLP